jgi:hypothetical protein
LYLNLENERLNLGFCRLAFLNAREGSEELLKRCDESINIEQMLNLATLIISPLLLPMISGLRELVESSV